jgi:DNA-directed RNA polymerase subunit RPC12/RpoP
MDMGLDDILSNILPAKGIEVNNAYDMGTLFNDMFENPEKYRTGSAEDIDAELADEDKNREQLKPSKWARKYCNIKGSPFRFKKHPYQVKIINDMHPKQVIEKAAQLGLSQIMLTKVFWFGDYSIAGSSGKIIYTFPTYADMLTYSAARIPPIIDESNDISDEDYGWSPEYLDAPLPYIKSMMEVNSAKLKKIRNTYLFLKGTVGDNSAISIDSDWNIHDEINFSNQSVLNKFKSRLGAAGSLGWEYNFSTPTIPGYGVSKLFQKSDQHYWYIKCPHCGKSYRMDFDRNLVELAHNKGFIYQCHNCKNEITDETRAKGFYICEEPSVKDLRGYHIDKMGNPNISANDLMVSKEGYKKVSDFYNFDLGVPYSEKSTALTLELLEQLKFANGGKPYEMQAFAQPDDYATLGMDQGDTLWVVISIKDKKTGKRKIIYMESVNYKDCDDEDPFRRIPELIERYNVHVAVGDALPNKNDSRKLKNLYADDKRYYMAYYTRSKEGDITNNDKEMEVNIDRTETFKWCFNRVYTGEFSIPSGADIVDVFEHHMCNLKKETDEDEETGDKYEAFVRTGPDHLAHANLYDEVARQILDNRLGDDSGDGGYAMAENPQWALRKGYTKHNGVYVPKSYQTTNPNAFGGVSRVPNTIPHAIRRGR